MSGKELNDIEQVRLRPAMYIGGADFFGLVHYFVSAVNLFLECSPSWIAIEVLDDRFRIRSDANLGVERTESGELLPFEKFVNVNRGRGLDGPVLIACSSRLTVSTEYRGSILRLSYERGRRTLEIESRGDTTESVIEFSPDNTLFTVSDFSSYNFVSYLHRISFLNPSVSFSFTEKVKLALTMSLLAFELCSTVLLLLSRYFMNLCTFAMSMVTLTWKSCGASRVGKEITCGHLSIKGVPWRAERTNKV